jgi:serine phosphatase RsbU (regulator of sigma subunit)
VQVEIIKADKEPIGYTLNPTPFTTHTIEIQKGDSLYMFTDGFADQFGGTNSKKIGYKKLRELLEENVEKDMQTQKQILDNFFENWKKEGNEDQMDDVCLIGFKI